MKYLAQILLNKYDVKCYKKNKNDKLYSFIFKLNSNEYLTDDLLVDRFICKEFGGLTLNELRGIKKHLRLMCELVDNINDVIFK